MQADATAGWKTWSFTKLLAELACLLFYPVSVYVCVRERARTAVRPQTKKQTTHRINTGKQVVQIAKQPWREVTRVQEQVGQIGRRLRCLKPFMVEIIFAVKQFRCMKKTKTKQR